MEKLTIEEKAKAYDEALEKAKQIIVEYDYDEHDNVFMEIFPELKKSEDEEVRKWLIAQLELKSDVDNPRDFELMILKSIAWLEKQCKPNPYSGASFDYNGNTWGMCARDNGVDILFNGKIIQHIPQIEK